MTNSKSSHYDNEYEHGLEHGYGRSQHGQSQQHSSSSKAAAQTPPPALAAAAAGGSGGQRDLFVDSAAVVVDAVKGVNPDTPGKQQQYHQQQVLPHPGMHES